MLWRNTVRRLRDPALMSRVVAVTPTFAGNRLLVSSMTNSIIVNLGDRRDRYRADP